MTRPSREHARQILDQWTSKLIVGCAVVTCVNLVGLMVALLLISGQAREGKNARMRQQAVYPVTVKVYTWAANDPRSHVTAADLACVKDSRRCPAPSKKTP